MRWLEVGACLHCPFAIRDGGEAICSLEDNEIPPECLMRDPEEPPHWCPLYDEPIGVKIS